MLVVAGVFIFPNRQEERTPRRFELPYAVLPVSILEDIKYLYEQGVRSLSIQKTPDKRKRSGGTEHVTEEPTPPSNLKGVVAYYTCLGKIAWIVGYTRNRAPFQNTNPVFRLQQFVHAPRGSHKVKS